MKRFFNISLIVIVFAGVLAINAHAQTKVIASIPFAFNAGNTTLPAGRYTITVLNPSSDRKILQIRSMNGRSSVVVMTTGIIGHASDNAKLVFERYGDRYVFAQAQLAGDDTALAAVRSKNKKASLVAIVAE
ncbi:MAG TPA: hypothetical protein VFX63_13570 [Pyrinomonadaceae bacterium]|nr:hypothetical protein [Pyrinomonadaceae bacterium]